MMTFAALIYAAAAPSAQETPWAAIIIAIVSSGALFQFLGGLLSRRKSNADNSKTREEARGVAVTTAESVITTLRAEIARKDAEYQAELAEVRAEQFECRARVNAAEAHSRDAEKRAEKAEYVAERLHGQIDRLTEQVIRHRKRTVQLEEVIKASGLAAPGWPDGDPA